LIKLAKKGRLRIYDSTSRAFILNDIQFEQAKFIKLAKKGRKNKNDQAKENVTIIHLILYNSFNQSINSHNLIEQQRILVLNNRRQQQLYPIFNNSKSV
jgi:hypothetical protein